MSKWKKYRRKNIPAEMRPYIPGEYLDGVSISNADKAIGSPKQGDMIARNPNNHNDQWLVEEEYFTHKFMKTPIGDCHDSSAPTVSATEEHYNTKGNIPMKELKSLLMRRLMNFDDQFLMIISSGMPIETHQNTLYIYSIQILEIKTIAEQLDKEYFSEVINLAKTLKNLIDGYIDS